jgi:hypothetical protein
MAKEKATPPRIVRSEAYLSHDLNYRYWLLRVWDDSLPVMANIGCNPSTADEKEDDPTIRKDMGFAQRLGFGGLLKLNVGAYRATDPKRWRNAANPWGEENTPEDLIDYLADFKVSRVVGCWEKCGGQMAHSRGLRIAALLKDEQFGGFWCFGRNADGTPRHTLMLPYSTKLEAWEGRNERT